MVILQILWRYHLLYDDVTRWWYHLLCGDTTYFVRSLTLWWYHLLFGVITYFVVMLLSLLWYQSLYGDL